MGLNLSLFLATSRVQETMQMGADTMRDLAAWKMTSSFLAHSEGAEGGVKAELSLDR